MMCKYDVSMTKKNHPLHMREGMQNNRNAICRLLSESRHEKTGFMHVCENKTADQLHSNFAADQRLCFRNIDHKIPLLPKSEISSL